MNTDITALAGWGNFFVIVGSSAGALIGLQFVVITLMAEMPNLRDAERASSAFATPTIVHFGSVLLLSAVLSAPWQVITGPVISLAVLGLAGMLYVVIVAQRMRVQTAYSPVFEDWVFYALLPFAAYTTLIGSAQAALWHLAAALFAAGAVALLLLFIGIHNAWDAVTYLLISKRSLNDGHRH